jgi:predicted helicase
MPRIEPELQRLQEIKTLPSLIKYLKDDLNWPIGSDDVESVVFDYDPAELGFDSASTAKIEEVCQLRPLTPGQKWGVFWVKFGKKQLPVQMLRRALGNLVVKKRTSSKKADKAAWHMHDLLFISAYGDDSNRHITFAHFSESEDSEKSLPVLKVLSWDEDDTLLHLKDTYKTLVTCLNWETTPTDDPEAWREHWSKAFKLTHKEVINTTKELVVELAQLATVIKKSVLTSIKAETEKGPWKKLMLAFQKTLIKDLDEDQFADVIAQTVSYGLLTARLSSDGQISLKNLVDMVPSTNPFLKELLQHFLTSAGMKGLFDVDEAGINDVVELLNRANAQAIRNDFGKKTDGEDPVIHFYEHFLGAYNKKLKVERGVFYTPKPVVSYMVRSVHELLQKEFGLEDGLADTSTWAEVQKKHESLKTPEGIKDPNIEPFVQILDPATGTATFLIEVIDVIHATMVAKWGKDHIPKAEQVKKWNTYVPTHLLPRLYAYELMMAPYAIAHMKIGLKLTETGFTDWEKLGPENRANIFLTNALEPCGKQLQLIGFDALAHEAAAVNEVKRSKRFTVIIGNPPYSGISSNMTDDAQRIVDAYKMVDGGALNERKLWLQDDYVKFIRNAQTTIGATGAGILGYITNHGYLDNPTFRGMRQSLLGTFPRLRVLDLHGNANKKEHSPDGSGDKNVFDIRQGVGICLASCVKKEKSVEHAELWGSREYKYGWLAANAASQTSFIRLEPDSPYYFFKPHGIKSRAEYDEGWRIPDIFPINSVGFVTARDELTIHNSAEDVWNVLQRFVSLGEEEARAAFDLGKDARDWRVTTAQQDIRKSGPTKKLINPILYRPFDVRFTYYTGNSRGFYASPCSNVMKHMIAGKNLSLCFNRREELAVSYSHFLASRLMTEHGLLSSKTTNSQAPLYLIARDDDDPLFNISASRPNLGQAFLAALANKLGIQQVGEFGLPADLTPEDIFHYAYAVFYSPSFRIRYAEFLKIDFPRLPLTGNIELFLALSRLGGELTALHLLESPRLDQPIAEFIGSRNVEVERVSWTLDTVWLDKMQTTGFRGVGESVWNLHIGGYRVCERWLKYRKGKNLTKDDIEHYQKILVALSETIRLMTEIDKVIDEHGGWPGAFQATK